MDAPAQARFAASIAKGSGKVQEIKFADVELETRKKVSRVDYINVIQEAGGNKKGMEREENVERVSSSAADLTDSEDDVPSVEL